MLNKLKRFLTSLLPVDLNRRGECNRCGECCKLPYPCPFLRFDEEGLSACSVYLLRPPSCRKYPRIATENLTPQSCGFYFIAPEQIARRPSPGFEPVQANVLVTDDAGMTPS
jgi:uncharacterized protein